MNTQTIKLNLIPGGIPPIIHVSQYDVGRPLAFELYDGLNAATIEAGTVIDIRATKPDGTGFEYACTWNNNVVSIATQAQMTVLSGSIECELHLVKDSQEIGTANFILEVEAAALRGDTDVSETDLPDIIDAARSSAAAAASSASDSEAYAVGKRDGVNVPNTDPTYHNNSKYYAGEAADSEYVAGLSATAAEISASDSEAYAVGKRDGVDVPNTDPTYHNNSKYYAGEADDSATAAASSESNAATSESNAEAYAIGKRGGVDVTSGDPAYENNSKYYAGEAATSKSDSEAYAVGKRGGVDVPSTDPTYNNNAKYYSEVAAQAAAGGLQPKGTCTFAQLPAVGSAATGDMWNISDAFTTTSDFREGAGAMYGAGANVYKTADGKWDVTAGQRVLMTGATANAAGTAGECSGPSAGDQDNYWTGAATWKSDTANLTTTYTTEDDANTTAIITPAGGETSISTMESGAKHSRLFNKMSRVALNTRKLINTVKRIWATVATSWATGETYAVGDVRLWTNGHTYVCKLAHTSSSSIKPNNTTYWEDKTLGDMIGSLNSNLNVIGDFVPLHSGNYVQGTDYGFDDVVTNYKFLYICAIESNYTYFGIIPTSVLNASKKYIWLSSFWQSTTSNESICFGISNTKASLSAFFKNGQSGIVGTTQVPATIYGVR